MLLLDVRQGGAPFPGGPVTDYDSWKLDNGEKTRDPAPCSVCDEMFHDDELNSGVCSKCEEFFSGESDPEEDLLDEESPPTKDDTEDPYSSLSLCGSCGAYWCGVCALHWADCPCPGVHGDE